MRVIRPHHLEYVCNSASETEAKRLEIIDKICQRRKVWHPADKNTLRAIEEKVGAAKGDNKLKIKRNQYDGWARMVCAIYRGVKYLFRVNFDRMDPKYAGGIPLNELNPEPLYPVPEEYNSGDYDKPGPEDLVPFHQKLEPLRKQIEHRWDKLENIKPYNLEPPYFRVFTFDEKVKLYFDSVIMMRIDHQFSEKLADDYHDDPKIHYAFIHKLKNSQWHYGNGSDWNAFVAAYNQIPTFDFGLPDFTVKLDMTTSFNECGYSKYTRTYLDGPLGYLVYYKGKHVLTIGFSLSTKFRLLINQVQLKNKKGNRWLYKLPDRYLDYVIARMAATFPNFQLSLVDGPSLADRIERAYGNEHVAPDFDRDKLKKIKQDRAEALARIRNFYNQELHQYKRGKKDYFRNLYFYQLVPIKESVPAPTYSRRR